VKTKRIIISFILVCLILSGCRNKQTAETSEVSRKKPVVQVDDVAFYQLFCNGFESLPLQSKRYAYHLYKAFIASRDISSVQSAPEVMIDELEKAAGYAPSKASSSLTELVKYLRTGDEDSYETYLKYWFQTEPGSVEFVFDLKRAEDDSLIQQDVFEAMVLIEDHHPDKLINTLMDSSSWFKANLPDDDAYKPDEMIKPFVKAYNVLYSTDYNLPLYRHFRKANRQKDFILTNVIETYNREAVARLSSINIVPRRAFIMPELELVRNRMAGVKDVVVRYTIDFEMRDSTESLP